MPGKARQESKGQGPRIASLKLRRLMKYYVDVQFGMSLIRGEACVHTNTLDWWVLARQQLRLRFNLCRWRVAPQPAHRVGENGRAVVGGVAAVAEDGFVVVVLELEGG